jgi:hypothetical protein
VIVRIKDRNYPLVQNYWFVSNVCWAHKSISANQETVLRHLEPALAIELELHRLKSYDITVRGPATPFLVFLLLPLLFQAMPIFSDTSSWSGINNPPRPSSGD